MWYSKCGIINLCCGYVQFTSCNATDDVDARAPIDQVFALAMKVMLQRTVRNIVVDKITLGSPFGAAEAQEADQILMFHLHQTFNPHLEVLLAEGESCVVNGFHSHDGAIPERTAVHGRVHILPDEVLLGEIICGRFEFVQMDPGAPLGWAGRAFGGYGGSAAI